MSPEERFWQWFRQNSDRLFRFENDQERVFDELESALAQVKEGLMFEFGPIEGGKRVFVVSADGVRDRFEAVRSLVAVAPAMPGWEIVPFRPPASIDLVNQLRWAQAWSRRRSLPSRADSYDESRYRFQSCGVREHYTRVQLADSREHVAVEIHEIGGISEPSWFSKCRSQFTTAFESGFPKGRVKVRYPYDWGRQTPVASP